jgi:mevalonate kinase
MHTGRGYGKVILFNEHFVVHRVPAIVSGIGDYTEAEVSTPAGDGPDCPIKAGDGLVIDDQRNATPKYKSDKENDQRDSIKYMHQLQGRLAHTLIWIFRMSA